MTGSDRRQRIDADRTGIDERGTATKQRDAGSRQQLLDAAAQLVGDLLLALDGLSEGGTVDVGFGGYAPAV